MLLDVKNNLDIGLSQGFIAVKGHHVFHVTNRMAHLDLL